MSKRYISALAAMVMLAAAALPTTAVFAGSGDSGSFLNGSGVPAGSKLCLNINYKVTNDPDSAVWGGGWALDSYNKHLQVWQVPDGSFYAIASYDGQWQTFQGAHSPQNNVEYTQDGSGTFHGGYVATFTAESCNGAQGQQGSFDFGGTQSQIVAGTYAPSPTFDWTSFFPGFSSFAQSQWSWTYRYQDQTWTNSSSGNSGDISF